METYSNYISKLIENFEKLPGIGHKTAQRLAFHILTMTLNDVEEFSKSLLEAKQKTKHCSVCCNLTDLDICKICSSTARCSSTICIVEDPKDVIALERIREFNGQYHVLHGSISPMNNIGPNDIKIKELLNRIQNTTIEEIIIATNPNVEGEATAVYISKLVKPLGCKTTRIAHGIPIGGDLEYADEVTLSKALEGRRDF